MIAATTDVSTEGEPWLSTSRTDMRYVPLQAKKGDYAVFLRRDGFAKAKLGPEGLEDQDLPRSARLVATADTGALVWQGGFEPFGADWNGAKAAGVFLRFPGQWVELARTAVTQPPVQETDTRHALKRLRRGDQDPRRPPFRLVHPDRRQDQQRRAQPHQQFGSLEPSAPWLEPRLSASNHESLRQREKRQGFEQFPEVQVRMLRARVL